VALMQVALHIETVDLRQLAKDRRRMPDRVRIPSPLTSPLTIGVGSLDAATT
jgi:hypothetical protein